MKILLNEMECEICLILPYFGKFNEYFNLWLKSCKYNNKIDWYIYTDDRGFYEYPKNVIVNYCNFVDIQKRAFDLFGNDIKLDKPYDLCKFRVAYHKLFPEVINKYHYWGYCDCDLIWGDLYSAISPALKKEYNKISWRGHFTLFKNSNEINELFQYKTPGNKTFEDCILKKNEINLFDEVGINRVFDYLNKPIYKDLLFADLKVKPFNFVCSHFSDSQEFKNKNQIFEWNKGKLYRIYICNGCVCKEEFSYIHFLRREMKYLIKRDSDHYLIVPNKFIDYQDLTASQIINLSKRRFYWRYYKKRLTPQYILKVLQHKIRKAKTPDIYPFIIK